MSERRLVAALIQDRAAFDRVDTHLEQADLSEQSRVIVDHLRTYYDRDPEAKRAEADILARDIGRAMTNPKHKETFEELVTALAEVDTSAANVVHDYIAVRKEATAARLGIALATGEGVADLIAEYEKWSQAEDLEEQEDDTDVMASPDLSELCADAFDKENLVELWPASLNAKLDGGLLPGHHVVIFARPEMGKTMFLVNAMAGFLSQGKRVLYVGNEEPLGPTVVRTTSRLTGLTKAEILEDPDAADAIVNAKGWSNMVFAKLSPGTPREIEKLVVQYKPDVLVIDQLRNLNVSEDQFVQKLEKAATAARNLGKRHNLVVLSVTQAGDSASGKGVLDMGDVDSSNTGIPAQADLMIGIGATKEDERIGRRIISLPKNKLSGDHGFFPVRIEPQLSLIGDIA